MTDQAAELRRLVTRGVAHPRPGLHVVAIASGKGGVGKTNIALNLGLALAQGGSRSALLDAHWGLSNAEVLLGIAPRRDLRHVLHGTCEIEEVIFEAPFGLKLLPSGSGVAEMANLSPADRAQLLRDVCRLSTVADLLLVDTPPGISDTVIDLVAAADQTLVVTTPELTALTDAYALVKVAMRRPCTGTVGLVVNMATDYGHARQIARGFSQVTERFLGCAVPLQGYLCVDVRVPDAVQRQSPFIVSHPRSAAADCVRELARVVLGGYASAEAFARRLS